MSSIVFFNRDGEEYFIGKVNGIDPMFVAKDGNPKLVLGSFSVEQKDVYNDNTKHFVGASLETMINGPHWDNPDCWEPPVVSKEDYDQIVTNPRDTPAKVEADDFLPDEKKQTPEEEISEHKELGIGPEAGESNR